MESISWISGKVYFSFFSNRSEQQLKANIVLYCYDQSYDQPRQHIKKQSWVLRASSRLSLAAASGAILWLRCVVVMWHVESSWSSDQTHVALHWQQILHHWTTREVPDLGYSGCGEIKVVCGHVSSVVGFGP